MRLGVIVTILYFAVIAFAIATNHTPRRLVCYNEADHETKGSDWTSCYR